MCFRLQTVVWKFLWRDWTFHWRVAERVAASQTALCETQLSLPAHLRIRRKPPGRGGGKGATPLRQHWRVEFLSSLVYADLGEFTNAIELRLAAGWD